MDGKKVKDMLNGRAQEVCEHLLPGGRVENQNYCIGDIRGATGQSLKIIINGTKVGVFSDFADAGVKGSNLLELWLQVRGCDFKQALTEAKDWLGVSDEPWAAAKPYGSPCPAKGGKKRLENELHPVKEDSKVWKYLMDRKISPEALKQYRIGEAFIKKGERHCVVFPSFDAEGNLVRMKFRDIADKSYMFLSPKTADAGLYEHGAELHLFGIQGVKDSESAVTLCEGEVDALSFATCGYPAVSLPIGAQASDTEDSCSHDRWIENDYDWLQQFVSIFLAMDADEPGQAAKRLLIPRLGRERVYALDYPDGCKDANDCLLNGHGLDGCIEHARSLDPEELRRAGEFREQVWDRFYPPDGQELIGDELPWEIGKFRFRPSEVTVWHGYNSHGKSRALGHCLLHFAQQNKRVLLASLEMPAAMTLQDMERQALQVIKPETREEHNRAMDWLDQYIWVYDFVGAAHSHSVLECWEYACRKYGCSHFVLDSMMKLSDVGGTDWESQKDLMNRFNDFAKRFSVHVHLVCHSKKPPSDRPKEKHAPMELDISGSSDVPNGAWNVLAVWRNEIRTIQIDKFKESLQTGKIMKGGHMVKLSEDDRAAIQGSIHELEQEHDSRIIIQKDRVGGIYPMPKNLWFDSESWQFGEHKGFRPIEYLE